MGISTLLIVEDNESHRYVMKQLCERFDYDAQFVSDAEHALMKLTAFSYSAVLIDIGLPGMSGTDLARHIRKADRLIPLIAVTGTAGTEDRLLYENAGFDDCLSKPFTAEQFRRILLRWVYESQKPNVKLLDKDVTNSGSHVPHPTVQNGNH